MGVAGLAGLLLTGGESRRFGSPKAEVRVGGERLADRTARVLAEVAEPVLEVGPGVSSLDALREDEPGAGPLAAVAAGAAALAARRSGERGVLVTAVDLPFLDAALLRLLAETLARAERASAVIPRVGGRAQPLCACYSLAALARADELVCNGARSMRALVAALDVVRWMDESDWGSVTTAACFADVDTPDDAHRFGLETPG